MDTVRISGHRLMDKRSICKSTPDTVATEISQFLMCKTHYVMSRWHKCNEIVAIYSPRALHEPILLSFSFTYFDEYFRFMFVDDIFFHSKQQNFHENILYSFGFFPVSVMHPMQQIS